MSQVFFDDLDIPHPDVYLGVGSGSHAPGLPGVPEPDGERSPGADRLWRHPGGDDDPGGVPSTSSGQACLTLRENTKRPVTVTQGTNTIVGNDPGRIVAEALAILNVKWREQGGTGTRVMGWSSRRADCSVVMQLTLLEPIMRTEE